METKPRVIVVGGGISGCAVAIELAAGDAEVTLVERSQPGVGATGASAGMLAPQYEAAEADAAFQFAVLCREAYPGFVERIESLASWDVGFRVDGMLVANRSAGEETEARRALSFQRAMGLPGEILSPADARRIHGGVSGDVPSWLWLSREAQVDSQRLAVCLADAVEGAGATLVRGVSVTAVRAEGSRVTGVGLSSGDTLPGDVVVLAAGAWSGEVEGVPDPVPVRPVRGQILRLLPPGPVPWVLVCDHGGRYLVPRANGTILVGSTMEEAGFDDRVTEEGREVLAHTASTLVPTLGDARIVEAWAGLRPISGDSWPVLGPDPELEGLFYATGQGRNGILFAPLVGRAVAELVLMGRTQILWEPFRIQRFREQPPG